MINGENMPPDNGIVVSIWTKSEQRILFVQDDFWCQFIANNTSLHSSLHLSDDEDKQQCSE